MVTEANKIAIDLHSTVCLNGIDIAYISCNWMKSSLQEGKTEASCVVSPWQMLLWDTHCPIGKAWENCTFILALAVWLCERPGKD